MSRISVNINLNRCLFVLFPFAFINLANARYKGGVILVSHDERLLKMVCQELRSLGVRVWGIRVGLGMRRGKMDSELRV